MLCFVLVWCLCCSAPLLLFGVGVGVGLRVVDHSGTLTVTTDQCGPAGSVAYSPTDPTHIQPNALQHLKPAISLPDKDRKM